eukprot:113521-Alexandrium_andersonii.AAC.1
MHEAHPTVRLTVFVDDASQVCSGGRAHILAHLTAAAVDFAGVSRRLCLTISGKSVVFADSCSMAARIAGALKRQG